MSSLEADHHKMNPIVKDYTLIEHSLEQIIPQLKRVSIRKGELWCGCPLGIHPDRNPSFSINLSEEIYYCFTCQSSGTVNQLAVKMGLREEGRYKPTFKRSSKPKVIQPWQRAKRIGQAFDTVEDVFKEAFRKERNILEENWNEGKISESKYYRDRQLLYYQFDSQMGVHDTNRNLLTWEAKRGNA